MIDAASGVVSGTAALRFRGWRFALKLSLLSAYIVLFLVRSIETGLPGLDAQLARPRAVVRKTVDAAVSQAGVRPASHFLSNGVYFTLVMLVVPWLVLACLRRGRPADLGWRFPAWPAARLLTVAYLVALPFVFWMAASPTFRPYYEADLRRGAAVFLSFYAFTMVSEHFLFHGVALAALYPGGRWPVRCGAGRGDAPDIPPPVFFASRALRRVGLAQPTGGAAGMRRATRWLGLPDHGQWPVLASGLLFALVHWGKDPRELLLSVPGGLASAWLAYRTDSLLTPLLLHLSTAGTAYLLMTLTV